MILTVWKRPTQNVNNKDFSCVEKKMSLRERSRTQAFRTCAKPVGPPVVMWDGTL